MGLVEFYLEVRLRFRVLHQRYRRIRIHRDCRHHTGGIYQAVAPRTSRLIHNLALVVACALSSWIMDSSSHERCKRMARQALDLAKRCNGHARGPMSIDVKGGKQIQICCERDLKDAGVWLEVLLGELVAELDARNVVLPFKWPHDLPDPVLQEPECSETEIEAEDNLVSAPASSSTSAFPTPMVANDLVDGTPSVLAIEYVKRRRIYGKQSWLSVIFGAFTRVCVLGINLLGSVWRCGHIL